MSPPFGKCIWCERTDFTDEHVIGQQFTKLLGIDFPIKSYWGDATIPGNGEVVLKDRVCDTCNKNWMRKLDNKMIKAMRPAIRAGGRVQLNERQQEIVAMWATKVALLLALRLQDLALQHPELLVDMGDAVTVPDDNLAAVERDKKRPPKGTRVWIGATDPRDHSPKFMSCPGSFAIFEAETPGGLALPVPHGYFVLFGLGRLVVYLSGCESPYAPNPPDYSPVSVVGRNALRQIWPSAERVAEWPPPKLLLRQDLEGIVQMPADWPASPQGWRRLESPPKPPQPE